jgi:uncharacterized protein YihD (DUF1040 family)
MRDPARIDRVLEALSAYWHANPDLRLCQIIGNFANSSGSYDKPEVSTRIYNTEDEQVLTYLQSRMKEPEHGRTV